MANMGQLLLLWIKRGDKTNYPPQNTKGKGINLNLLVLNNYTPAGSVLTGANG